MASPEQPDPARPATLEDVARRAGVSTATVSRLLTPGPEPRRVDALRRLRKIQQAAADLGYRPHAAARSTRTGRFNAVGVQVTRGGGWMPTAMLTELLSAAAKRNLQMHFSVLPRRDLRTGPERLPAMFRELCVDATLIDCIVGDVSPLQEQIRRFRIPAVWLNRKMATDCVRPDDFTAGRDAARHLLRLGHRRIGVTGSNAKHYSFGERLAGARAAMREAGLEMQYVNVEAEGPARVADWLRQADRPTGLVCLGGSDSRPLALAVAQTVGLRIPEDLSVVTIDTGMISGRRYDSIELPFNRLAHHTLNMLITKIDRPEQEVGAVLVPFRPLTEAGTCAAPDSSLTP